MRKWMIRDAKAKFSALLKSTKRSPQVITDRGEPVAALMNIKLFEKLMALMSSTQKVTIHDSLDALKKINSDENQDLDILPRSDRPNPILDEDDKHVAV